MALVLVAESVIDQRPDWVLAVNRNQNLLGKLLLVLRRPCTSVSAISPSEWEALHVEIKRATSALEQLFQPDQLNFAFLMNVDAQVHLHIIPRYASTRRWRNLEFTDPDWGAVFGRQSRHLGSAELQLLADEIRAELPPSV